MSSLFDSLPRARLIARLQRLRADAPRRWGRMNAPQMVCHLTDTLRLTVGDLPFAKMRSPLAVAPIKYVVLYLLPWPRGRVVGAPEAFQTAPANWAADLEALAHWLTVFGAQRERRDWPAHPQFGPMSARLWDQFTQRHFEHHLRQFNA